MLKKIIFSLIIINLLLVNKEIYDYFNMKNKEKIVIGEVLKEKQVIVHKKDVIPNSYLGYIEIESLNIKKLIKYGTTDKILNQNIVGVHIASTKINNTSFNIILAGHNNKYVFKNLTKIKILDTIKIVTVKNNYLFQVIKTDIINKDNYHYFERIDNEKLLTLITCYNKDKRFIVVAKLL